MFSLAVFIPVVAVSLTGAASAQGLKGLEELQKGRWEIRIRGGANDSRSVCLGDPYRHFVRIRHPDQACKTVATRIDENEVTVQYTCPGNGFGRTSVRKETPRLVQIDGQGVADGIPFVFNAEARRVGTCRP
nr:hypothetical protein [Novosphingobium marinum]